MRDHFSIAKSSEDILGTISNNVRETRMIQNFVVDKRIRHTPMNASQDLYSLER